MARYKHIDTNPRFLAVDLQRQLLPVSFEHALDRIIDHEVDLGGFHGRYKNDLAGASAYPPGMLLKIVLFAYSRGVVSSRGIERACREHVTFIALSGDSAPHFTTIAAFVSGLGGEIAKLFAQVLYLCDRQGLIGREMFAIDGVKLPSNASKAKSGKELGQGLVYTRQFNFGECHSHGAPTSKVRGGPAAKPTGDREAQLLGRPLDRSVGRYAASTRQAAGNDVQ